MQLKTIKKLTGNVFSVRLETTLTDTEKELINDFTEPSVDGGGDFFASQVTISANTISVGADVFGDASGATGELISQTLIRRKSVTAFTSGEGLNSSLATITGIVSIDYTISTNVKKIESQFPLVETFDGTTDNDAEDKADTWGAELKSRLDVEITTLKANTDTFSSEEVSTL